MLEEKNDNLHDADGTPITGAGDTFENGYIPENKAVSNEELPEDTEDLKEQLHETEGQLPFAPAEVTGAEPEETPEAEKSEETTAPEPVAEEVTEVVETSEEPVSAEAEHHDEDHSEEVPDYGDFSMEQLTAELEKLTSGESALSVKNRVEEIRREFYNKYNHFIEEKRDEYTNDNGGDTSGFEYHFPLKNTFDSLYNKYRDQKNAHFKKVQNDQKANLDNRIAIIEELKVLADNGSNLKDSIKQVNELRERWKNAGPIPRDKYNHVFNNFHFHIERFYDQLHLDREARDLDFKHNLDQKLKIIARAEELANDTDVSKAFRELQALHKIWKEEIGPVSREHREEIWNRFSELTKQIHEKREALVSRIRETENENLKKKQEIIAGIEAVAAEKVTAHNAWQGLIDRVEALREEFFKAGKVPQEVNEEVWAAFKDAVRNFNSVKNSFYKDIKKDQQTNLNRKLALVEKANELKESDDFAATTAVMKQIQEEWKTIGHVPRKYSDAVWKDFKAACNHYFDRLHAHRNEANKDELDAFEKKKEYLDNLKTFELTGNHKEDLDAIKQHIENWKTLGRVPQARRHIEGKFNKILDALFDKLSLSKKESEMVRFNNRLEQLSEGDNNTRRLENEQIFIMRKIEEVQSEIFQLENNIQFISNAKADNPFVKEVYKSIERHKEELKTWKEKLKHIRTLTSAPPEEEQQ
ncbi:DUF349 domain-containing protein [Flavobacterium sp. RHBU_3]|uniref:DUF349 domain-containing protein n=1 Tax=Flavobacterium sp. RHBU_3 TaxID=3391184 RepID=UPI0039854029